MDQKKTLLCDSFHILELRCVILQQKKRIPHLELIAEAKKNIYAVDHTIFKSSSSGGGMEPKKKDERRNNWNA